MVESGTWPALVVNIGIAIAWLGLVGATAWYLYDRLQVDSEIVRKVVHIGTGHVVLIAWWLQIPGWVAIAASIFFSGVALFSYYVPILPGLESVGRKSWGTFFYAASIGGLVACFWADHPELTALGILVMTWGDGLAALVGRRWGHHPYHVLGNQKSWEGSLTMAIASFCVCVAVLGASQLPLTGGNLLILSSVVSLIAMVLEMFSKLGVDNLTVPLGSAAIAFWLSQLLTTA